MIVEPLKGNFTRDQLIEYYKQFGGKFSVYRGHACYYLIRMKEKQVIHFYIDNPHFTGGSMIFKSEGHYDEHSPYWNG